MLHKGQFSDFIHPFTLKFTLPSLEARLDKSQEQRVALLGSHKIVILILAVIQMIIMILAAFYQRSTGNVNLANSIIADTIVAAC